MKTRTSNSKAKLNTAFISTREPQRDPGPALHHCSDAETAVRENRDRASCTDFLVAGGYRAHADSTLSARVVSETLHRSTGQPSPQP